MKTLWRKCPTKHKHDDDEDDDEPNSIKSTCTNNINAETISDRSLAPDTIVQTAARQFRRRPKAPTFPSHLSFFQALSRAHTHTISITSPQPQNPFHPPTTRPASTTTCSSHRLLTSSSLPASTRFQVRIAALFASNSKNLTRLM